MHISDITPLWLSLSLHADPMLILDFDPNFGQALISKHSHVKHLLCLEVMVLLKGPKFVRFQSLPAYRMCLVRGSMNLRIYCGFFSAPKLLTSPNLSSSRHELTSFTGVVRQVFPSDTVLASSKALVQKPSQMIYVIVSLRGILYHRRSVCVLLTDNLVDQASVGDELFIVGQLSASCLRGVEQPECKYNNVGEFWCEASNMWTLHTFREDLGSLPMQSLENESISRALSEATREFDPKPRTVGFYPSEWRVLRELLHVFLGDTIPGSALLKAKLCMLLSLVSGAKDRPLALHIVTDDVLVRRAVLVGSKLHPKPSSSSKIPKKPQSTFLENNALLVIFAEGLSSGRAQSLNYLINGGLHRKQSLILWQVEPPGKQKQPSQTQGVNGLFPLDVTFIDKAEEEADRTLCDYLLDAFLSPVAANFSKTEPPCSDALARLKTLFANPDALFKYLSSARELEPVMEASTLELIKLYFLACRQRYDYPQSTLERTMAVACCFAKFFYRTSITLVDGLVAIMMAEETRVSQLQLSALGFRLLPRDTYNIDRGYEGESPTERFDNFANHVIHFIMDSGLGNQFATAQPVVSAIYKGNSYLPMSRSDANSKCELHSGTLKGDKFIYNTWRPSFPQRG